MELRTEIKQEFLAVINGIEFNRRNILYGFQNTFSN